VSEPVDLNYMQHTVLLQYLELVELRNWLTSRRGTGAPSKKLTLGRVTFQWTDQNGMFIVTTPDPTRAKPDVMQKEILDDDD
jgi:hypothetical protein